MVTAMEPFALLIMFVIGFAIGLVAALTERSKRQRAEAALSKAEEYAREQHSKAAAAWNTVAKLRTLLESTQKRLAECDDVEALRQWLTETLRTEVTGIQTAPPKAAP